MHRRSFVKWGALAGMTFAQQRLSFAAAPTPEAFCRSAFARRDGCPSRRGPLCGP